MKKIVIGMVSIVGAILMGEAVSTLDKYLGTNLSERMTIGVITFAIAYIGLTAGSKKKIKA